MRVIIFLISSVIIYACTGDKDPFDYSNSFLKLADKWDSDFEYLGQQIDSMGAQIKRTGKIDSSLFNSSIATVSRLTKKYEFQADSLANSEPYKNDNSIKKKSIDLLRLYGKEILPVYELYITDHYNVYGKNDITQMTELKQDSLNQIVMKANEKILDTMDKQVNETKNIRFFIEDWIQVFRTKKHGTQHNAYRVAGFGILITSVIFMQCRHGDTLQLGRACRPHGLNKAPNPPN